eukprot:gene9576-biopygen1690
MCCNRPRRATSRDWGAGELALPPEIPEPWSLGGGARNPRGGGGSGRPLAGRARSSTPLERSDPELSKGVPGHARRAVNTADQSQRDRAPGDPGDHRGSGGAGQALPRTNDTGLGGSLMWSETLVLKTHSPSCCDDRPGSGGPPPSRGARCFDDGDSKPPRVARTLQTAGGGVELHLGSPKVVVCTKNPRFLRGPATAPSGRPRPARWRVVGREGHGTRAGRTRLLGGGHAHPTPSGTPPQRRLSVSNASGRTGGRRE